MTDQLQRLSSPPPPPPPEAAAAHDDSSLPPPSPPRDGHNPPTVTEPPILSPPRFDPSRMIGIIKRKALIKDLAGLYHAECLSYCPELLELQRQPEESFADIKSQEHVRKEVMKPPKRMKKVR